MWNMKWLSDRLERFPEQVYFPDSDFPMPMQIFQNARPKSHADLISSNDFEFVSPRGAITYLIKHDTWSSSITTNSGPTLPSDRFSDVSMLDTMTSDSRLSPAKTGDCSSSVNSFSVLLDEDGSLDSQNSWVDQQATYLVAVLRLTLSTAAFQAQDFFSLLDDLANLYWAQGRHEACRLLLRPICAGITSSRKPMDRCHESAKLLLIHGVACFFCNHLDDALDSVEMALRLTESAPRNSSNSLDDFRLETQCRVQMAAMHNSVCQSSVALQYLKMNRRCLRMLQKNPELQLSYYYNTAHAQLNLGRLIESATTLNSALRLTVHNEIWSPVLSSALQFIALKQMWTAQRLLHVVHDYLQVHRIPDVAWITDFLDLKSFKNASESCPDRDIPSCVPGFLYRMHSLAAYYHDRGLYWQSIGDYSKAELMFNAQLSLAEEYSYGTLFAIQGLIDIGWLALHQLLASRDSIELADAARFVAKAVEQFGKALTMAKPMENVFLQATSFASVSIALALLRQQLDGLSDVHLRNSTVVSHCMRSSKWQMETPMRDVLSSGRPDAIRYCAKHYAVEAVIRLQAIVGLCHECLLLGRQGPCVHSFVFDLNVLPHHFWS